MLRRLSLDLTGLPPSPEELKRFADTPWAQVIAHYLATPAYAERMTAPWLDLVRFADTVGIHGDQGQRIFPYRDYVIESFANNKPFNEFITEQLAGDLLPNAGDEQWIASGFNRLSQMTREGGAQPKEYLAKYSADRVRAIGTAFLGQTIGCAECHDHKYDPISTRDFYSLGAFFSDIKQWGVYSDYRYTPNPDLKGWNNNKPFPPEHLGPNRALNAEINRKFAQAIELLASRPLEPSRTDDWKSQILPFVIDHPQGWQTLEITAESSAGTPLTTAPDHSLTLTGTPKKGDIITITAPLPDFPLATLRIEVIPSPSLGRSPGGSFSLRPSFALSSAEGKPSPLKIHWQQADLDNPSEFFNGQRKNSRLEATWRSAPGRWDFPKSLATHLHTAIYTFSQALPSDPKRQLIITIASSDVTRLRLSATPFSEVVPGRDATPPGLIAALKNPEPSAAEQATIRAAWQLANTPANKRGKDYEAIATHIHNCHAGWARSMTTVAIPEQDRPPSRILARGDWQDESSPLVEPAVLHFLPSESVPTNRKLNRLDLANWITSPENPLTARHFVNRTWKQFFGNGLSGVLDDLGGQGEWPSHPALLDWLASEFRDSGWDVQHVIRLIVSSNTYLQQADTRSDLSENDPQNRLLAQQSGRRLDAEFVRDNALFIAGLLDTSTLGGPSIFPYQPANYYEPLNFPVRGYPVQNDARQYRRGLYMHWQRTFLHPMLANFDAPSREECSADRLQSNSPQQALTLLNDPTFIEASRAFADRLFLEAPSASSGERIRLAFQLALSRDPTAAESKSLLKFLEQRLAAFHSGKDDPQQTLGPGMYRQRSNTEAPELAAWSQLCRALLNLHETITRY